MAIAEDRPSSVEPGRLTVCVQLNLVMEHG